MKPKKVKKPELIIVGAKGGEFETGAVWQKFLDLYDKYALFEQISNNEILKAKLYMKEKTEVYIGMVAGTNKQNFFYRHIIIPEFEYFVFKIPAVDYVEKLKEIEEWMKNHKEYNQGKVNGNRFLIEQYGEEFDENDLENSKIEIWIPIVKKE